MKDKLLHACAVGVACVSGAFVVISIGAIFIINVTWPILLIWYLFGKIWG